jgi:hypothetical protein
MLTLGMSQLIVHINIHLSSLIKKLVNDLFNTMLFLAQGRSHFIRIKTSLIKAFNPLVQLLSIMVLMIQYLLLLVNLFNLLPLLLLLPPMML